MSIIRRGYIELLETIIEATEGCQLELNEWEQEFTSHIYGMEYGSITEKQFCIIKKIHDRIG